MNDKIFEAARALADELRADIELCATRVEHIRVTARANAAAELVQMLFEMTDDRK
jgi:hypothetical protein